MKSIFEEGAAWVLMILLMTSLTIGTLTFWKTVSDSRTRLAGSSVPSSMGR